MSINEWGSSTWKLFHTLAEEVNESKFLDYKDNLIKLVFSICQHLPCPDCSHHASNILLKKAYIKNIQTKQHFIEFIRQMHNIVNIKLQKKTFTNDEIENMYKEVNITSLLNEFFNVFFRRHYNTKLMVHNTKREQFRKPLIEQLNKIRPAFIKTEEISP